MPSFYQQIRSGTNANKIGGRPSITGRGGVAEQLASMNTQRVADPVEAGKNIGVAGAALAAIGQIGQAYQAAQDLQTKQDEAAAVAEHLTFLNELNHDAVQEAQDNQYDVEGYIERMNGMRDSLMSGIPEYMRQDANIKFNDLLSRSAMAISDARVKMQEDENNAKIAAAIDAETSNLFDAERDGNSDAAALSHQTLQGLVDSRSDMTPTQKQAYLSKIGEDALVQNIIGQYDVRFKNGGIGAAKAFFNELQTSDIVKDPFLRDKIAGNIEARISDEETKIRRAQAEAEAAQAEAKRSAIYDVNAKIIDGTGGYADIQSLVDKGLIQRGDPNWSSLTKSVQSVNEYAIEQNAYSRVSDAVLSGDLSPQPQNKDYQKAINAAAPSYLQTLVQKPDGTAKTAYEMNTDISEYVSKVGMVPDAVRDMIDAGTYGTPEKAAIAADLVSRIQYLSPQLIDPTDKKYTRLSLINQAVRLGQPIDKAVEKADKAMNPDNAGVIDIRRKAARDVLKDNPVDLPEMFNGWFSFAPDISPDMRDKMQDDYNTVVAKTYEDTGDATTALESGQKYVQRSYGVTEIGGKTSFMKFPPEMFYNIDNARRSFDEDVKSLGHDPKKALIVADRMTEQEARLPTPAPSYSVWVKQEDGTLKSLGRFKPTPRDSHVQTTYERFMIGAKRAIAGVPDQIADVAEQTRKETP